MPTPADIYVNPYPPTLASDSDREHTVGILREHWLAGRLSFEEFEARSSEALSGRYLGDLWQAVRELPVASVVPAAPLAPPTPTTDGQQGSAVTSVVLSSIALALFCLSFSLLWLVTLPMSFAGWLVGRSARRSATVASTRGTARTGEVLGLIGTLVACMALAACAAIVAR